MLLIGLTGGIASGKSSVAKILQENGCAVIDADLIAREVVSVNSKGWRLIRKHFGEDICGPDGSIDRKRLGEIIFSDSAQRRRLNAITHPVIRRRMILQVIKYFLSGYRYIIIDSPLLIETKGPISCVLSEIVIVYCDEELQCERLMSRDNLTLTQANNRISSQMPLKDKKRLATKPVCLIDNNGSESNTREQVLRLKDYLDSSWRPAILRTLLLLIVSVPLLALTFY